MLINRNDVPAVLQPAIDYELTIRRELNVYVDPNPSAPTGHAVGDAVEVWWPRSDNTRSLDLRFGDAVVTYDGPWRVVHGDHIVTDDNGTVIAAIEGRRVRLAFEPSRLATDAWRDPEDSPLIGNRLSLVIGDLLAECLPIAARGESDTHHWVAAKLAATNERIAKTRSDLAANDRRLWDLERELFNVAKKIDEQRQLLSLLDHDVAAHRRRNAREESVNAGRLVPQAYHRIAVRRDAIVARTSEVFIAYDGETFGFGRFDVVIHLPSGSVTAVTVDNANLRQGYPHPHIDSSSEGHICLGNMAKPLKEAIAAGHVVEALSTVRAFLSHYNPENPYLPISRWGDEDVDEVRERHERCFEGAIAFDDCRTCDDDTCPYWDDRYDRCWDDGPAMRDCVECGRCEHAADDALPECREEHADDGGCVRCRVSDCEHQGQGPDDDDEDRDNDDGEELIQIGSR